MKISLIALLALGVAGKETALDQEMYYKRKDVVVFLKEQLDVIEKDISYLNHIDIDTSFNGQDFIKHRNETLYADKLIIKKTIDKLLN